MNTTFSKLLAAGSLAIVWACCGTASSRNFITKQVIPQVPAAAVNTSLPNLGVANTGQFFDTILSNVDQTGQSGDIAEQFASFDSAKTDGGTIVPGQDCCMPLRNAWVSGTARRAV